MADKHSLNYDVRELKLGASFTNNKASQYHTIKYDFKPASVDLNKMATVDVGTNNQVTVTVPHLDGAGVPHTVFKGSQRPYTKECVLIIDRVTGEITLEKLSSNIQVKKTRQESSQKPRPLTPVTADFTNVTQRSSSRTRVATNKRTSNPPPGPSNAASSQSSSQSRFNGPSASKNTTNIIGSPTRVKATTPQAPWSSGGNSTLASLPMIGFDDGLGLPPAHSSQPPHNGYAAPAPPPPRQLERQMERQPERQMERQPERQMERQPERQMERQPERSKTEKNLYQLERNTNLDRSQSASQLPIVNSPSRVIEHPQADSSSSSSSDSGSGSDSDSDSDDNDSSAHHSVTNGNPQMPSLPSDVLNDDLCLSESGSDSD